MLHSLARPEEECVGWGGWGVEGDDDYKREN